MGSLGISAGTDGHYARMVLGYTHVSVARLPWGLHVVGPSVPITLGWCPLPRLNLHANTVNTRHSRAIVRMDIGVIGVERPPNSVGPKVGAGGLGSHDSSSCDRRRRPRARIPAPSVGRAPTSPGIPVARSAAPLAGVYRIVSWVAMGGAIQTPLAGYKYGYRTIALFGTLPYHQYEPEVGHFLL